MDASSQKYAMLHWTLCTAYLDGVLDRPTYQAELLKLVDAGTKAMTAQSSSPASKSDAAEPAAD
jgi:hypothetical protein